MFSTEVPLLPRSQTPRFQPRTTRSLYFTAIYWKKYFIFFLLLIAKVGIAACAALTAPTRLTGAGLEAGPARRDDPTGKDRPGEREPGDSVGLPPRADRRSPPGREPSGAGTRGAAGCHGNGGARAAPPCSPRPMAAPGGVTWGGGRRREGLAGPAGLRPAGAAAMFGGLGRCFEEDPFFR